MCTGMELALAASLASTAVGTGMQVKEQSKAKKRISQQLAATSERNEELQRNAQQNAFAALEEFTPEKFAETQEIETGNIKQKLLDALSGGEVPGDFYGGRRSESTQKFIEEKSGEASDFSEQMADALANLRGFQSGMRRGGEGITTAAEKAAMNRAFQAGNTAILPGQIEAIKAGAQNPFADVMVGLGSVGTAATLPATGLFGPTDITAKTAGGVGQNIGGRAIDISQGFTLA